MKYSSDKKLPKSLQEKIKLSDSFPPVDPYKGYVYPIVDECTEEFQWTLPNIETIQFFLAKNLGWDTQTVSLRVGPALKKVSEMMEICSNSDKVSRDRTLLSYFEKQDNQPHISQSQKTRSRVKSTRMKTIILKLLHKKYPDENLSDTESSTAKNKSKKRTRNSSNIIDSSKKKKRKSGTKDFW